MNYDMQPIDAIDGECFICIVFFVPSVRIICVGRYCLFAFTEIKQTTENHLNCGVLTGDWEEMYKK